MAKCQVPAVFFALALFFSFSTCPVYGLSNGALRLYRNGYTSSSYYYGIVRVYYNGWGNICDDYYYSYTEANVICHQLGYTGVSSYARAGLTSYGTDYLSMKLDDVNCASSNYLTIFQCSFSTYIDSGCTNLNSYDATVYCYNKRIWNSNPFPGMIRLQRGSYSNQGRVEVYCNGQWGTICDDGFGYADARTICKQLGYNNYYRYDHLSLPGNSSQPIWTTYMSSSSSDICYGTRNSCPSTRVTTCSHSEDVTIECTHSTSFFKVYNTKTTCSRLISSQNSAVILYRNGGTSTSYYYGIVRVNYNGWGNICDDSSYDYSEANVICHQLGYTGASSYSRAGLMNYGNDTLLMKMDDLNCANSNYLTIFQCSFSTSIDSGCNNTSSYDATVYCYTTRIWDSNPFEGMIRLQGGDFVNQGRVEVYCNGQWGTICDDGFGSNDARTICKQLGYNYYFRYDHLRLSGSYNQSIWNTFMSSSSSDKCYGTRNSCPSTSIISCSHYEDVTVECTYSLSYSKSVAVATTCSGLISRKGFGAILLYRNGVTSSSYYYGIVQILYNGQWGNICDDYNYNKNEADVICHQLGYTGASSYSRAGLVSYGTDYSSMTLTRVNCPNNNYLTILQCSYSTYIYSGCTSNSYDATVYCYTTRIWDNHLYPGKIRLQRGSSSNEGLVEVYCNGQWGTICDDRFDGNDALTICNQLGYNHYYRYNHLNISGNFSQPIWSTRMNSTYYDTCYSTRNSCPSSPFSSCTNSSIVTVECIHATSISKSSNRISSCYTDFPDGNGPIRLYRNGVTSSSYYYGIVQIYINNDWGNICDDIYYNSAEADVICHQLGYTGASSYSRAGLVSYGNDNFSMRIDDLSCSESNYLTIFQCSYSTYIDSGCTNTNSYDATVYCYTTRVWSSNPYSGMIRLQGGNYSNQGRVEVYCNGQWGTICNSGFGSIDAQTICKQLGYNYYRNYNHLNLSGNSGQPIWGTNMFSSSTDKCYSRRNSCPSTSVTSCSHSEDITIECSYYSLKSKSDNKVPSVCSLGFPSGNGVVRLHRNGVTSSSYYYGIVQIYFNGKWGNICDDYQYNQFEADVICHQLGYVGASSFPRAGLTSYGTDGLSMIIDDVNCAKGSYLTILQCSYSTYIDFGCVNTNAYDATVSCYTTRMWDGYRFPGMIRLQGGIDSNQGRVEVYCNGQWGTICRNGFSFNDAQTICKQLGYNYYYRYNHLSLSGNSSQPIWSTNMLSTSIDKCFGARNSCPRTPVTSCNHANDVTIECTNRRYYTRSTNTIYTCEESTVANGVVRLYRNGITSSSYYYGIVQIRYNGHWGNICDDSYYNQYEADVICHQLGYTGASSYSRAGSMKYSFDYNSMLLDDVNCVSNNYLTIFQCSFSTYIDSGCTNTNSYDATVYCYTTRIWNINPLRYMIRLQGGNYSNEGRVEVYCNGQWGTICNNGFDSTDARTICKQLGYNSYSSYNHLSLSSNSRQPIWGTHMSSSSTDRCYGTRNTCPLTPITSCNRSNIATVECSYSTFNSKSTVKISTCDVPDGRGVVRLYRNGVTSSSYYYGIVQIYFNGQWGNICDDSRYNQYEADVICHQLGYIGASSYSRAGLMSYGTDYNSMRLNRVNCNNNKYLTILQCLYSTYMYFPCRYNSYDATVYCYTTRIWDSKPYSGMIRLQGGNFVNQGRVEVYCNGQWGTICNDGFDSDDANMICIQLGYTNYTYYGHLIKSGSSNQPIWSTQMSSKSSDKCYGTSNACPTSSVTSCTHSKDITIACTSKFYSPSTSSCRSVVTDTIPSGNGVVRLYRNGVTSSSYYYGIVQIWYNGHWGNICDDTDYNQYEADVICHQLGYTGALSYSRAGLISYGTDNNPMLLDNVNCPNNNYLTILQCSYSTDINDECNANSFDATVNCYTTRIWNSNPYPGMIRLQGGIYSNEGRVEVYCNGQWGTICNDGFDSNDANTICKQLGYSVHLSYNHFRSKLSQPIWLTNMNSYSSDQCITSNNICPSTAVNNCNLSEIVNVECTYSNSYSKPSNTKSSCDSPNSNGVLRLFRNGITSSLHHFGIVQIQYNGQWGNICDDDDDFGQYEADVICHQLGYTGASSYSRAGVINYGTDSNPMLLDDVNCAHNNYLTILQCSYSTRRNRRCTDYYDATVYCYSTMIWESNPYTGMIRLEGGHYSNQGRVEVYCNGQWGTICSDGFDFKDAYTVCRQLGYTGYVNYNHLALTGVSSRRIWISNMNSSYSDSCFIDSNTCPSTANTACSNGKDVTIECTFNTAYTITTTKLSCVHGSAKVSEGTVRLYRTGATSSSYYYGIVQIYLNNGWGNICGDNSYSSTEADVTCHQLGYIGASSYTKAEFTRYGTDYNPTLLSKVKCDHNDYLTILQCSYSTTIDSGCTSNSYDATVYCYTTRIWDSNPFPGMIRLQGGVYSNEGRVEVYCNGQWGTICDDGFGANDALVFCKQLGYSNYTSYNQLAFSGNSSQHIWMSNLACSNSFSCLGSCQSCPTNPYDRCSHSEDVTLQCSNSMTLSAVSTLKNTCRRNDSVIVSRSSVFISVTVTAPVSPIVSLAPFSSSGHSSLNGTVIGSIVTISIAIIIVALICCITVAIVVIIKYRKKHSGLYYDNQQVELDTVKVPFPDTTKSQIQDPCPHYDEVNRSEPSTTGTSYSILTNEGNQEVSDYLPVGVRNPSYGNVPQGNESQDMET